MRWGWFIGIAFLLLLVGGGGYLLYINREVAEPPVVSEPEYPKVEVIGKSVEGRAIEAYTYGSGAKHLLFVGGIHGGYEWNSVLLAYQFIDYLKARPDAVPAGVTVTVVPSANPDGLYKVMGKVGRFTAADVTADDATQKAGRFNAHQVDLNRNFECKWQATSTWQGNPVSAGTAAFSEPEAKTIKDFVLAYRPSAAVFWHSQANAVYASECTAGVLPSTRDVMNTYATAAGYKAIDTFDAYPVTGDAEGWLASINIPAITVELSTHESVEWEKNLRGIEALFNLYK